MSDGTNWLHNVPAVGGFGDSTGLNFGPHQLGFVKLGLGVLYRYGVHVNMCNCIL